MKTFVNEFKTFAIKGNMIDMAVGIIVGGAFTALITSIVFNLANPLIGILIGFDLSSLEYELPRLFGNAEPTVLGLGLFLNNLISFLTVAIIVFLFVKALNRFRRRQDAAPKPAEPTKQEILLAEIRDILKEQKGN